MNIGVVVHGPNIIDSGYALKLIEMLKNYGDVKARLGGTMGRTAVIDAGLEDIIDISKKLVPSDSLKLFRNEDADVIFLINYGKSDVTGQVFGYKVYNHYADKINENNIPVIQIERPGEKDGSIIQWNGESGLADELSFKLNLKTVTPEEVFKNHIQVSNSKIERIVHGVSPDENIMVNSIVIGKTNSSFLKLISKDGYIVDIEGGNLKPHGLEKLGKIDLENAIIKTGLLRKSDVEPRIIAEKHEGFKIALVNHAGEDVYKFRNCQLIITVGDDTTLISSDILYRFAIPIIGITDGDLDKVVLKGYKTEGSVIFELESGYDDIAGCKIQELIFKNKDINDSFTDADQVIDEIIKILNNMNIKYKIKKIK